MCACVSVTGGRGHRRARCDGAAHGHRVPARDAARAAEVGRLDDGGAAVLGARANGARRVAGCDGAVPRHAHGLRRGMCSRAWTACRTRARARSPARGAVLRDDVRRAARSSPASARRTRRASCGPPSARGCVPAPASCKSIVRDVSTMCACACVSQCVCVCVCMCVRARHPMVTVCVCVCVRARHPTVTVFVCVCALACVRMAAQLVDFASSDGAVLRAAAYVRAYAYAFPVWAAH